MKKLFVSYELALLAKNKGFNEKCFSVYVPSTKKYLLMNIAGEPRNSSKIMGNHCLAPVYQQLVDWFEEKHGIFINASPVGLIKDKNWQYYGVNLNTSFGDRLFYHMIEKSTKQNALSKALEEAFKLI